MTARREETALARRIEERKKNEGVIIQDSTDDSLINLNVLTIGRNLIRCIDLRNFSETVIKT